MLCAFASQKRYMSLYVEPRILDRHRTELQDLNLGKSCIRFKSIAQLPLSVVRTVLDETVKARDADRAQQRRSEGLPPGSRARPVDLPQVRSALCPALPVALLRPLLCGEVPGGQVPERGGSVQPLRGTGQFVRPRHPGSGQDARRLSGQDHLRGGEPPPRSLAGRSRRTVKTAGKPPLHTQRVPRSCSYPKPRMGATQSLAFPRHGAVRPPLGARWTQFRSSVIDVSGG